MIDDLSLDATAPVFFVSHAHRDGSGLSPLVARFFDDLSTNVNELLPLATGHEPGFIDTNMRGGELWEAELRRAIGRCQVLVPLLSQRFVRSDWCRFEWDSFNARTVRVRASGDPPEIAGTQAAIVPVGWTVIDPLRLPESISKVQTFTLKEDPDIADAYHHNGVFGLLQMERNQQYKVVVWRLAQLIAEIVYRFDVEPRLPLAKPTPGKTFLEGAP